jgi:hypothetical protein
MWSVSLCRTETRLEHSYVLDIVGVESSHRNTAVSGEVDVGLLGEGIALGGSQASKAAVDKHRNRVSYALVNWVSPATRHPREHADLALDVTPFSRSVPVHQAVVERVSHRDDAISHA